MNVLNNLRDDFGNIFGEESDVTFIIPDTNAFYNNPNIENWTFKGMSKMCIVVTPTIISELDKHKVDSSRSSRQQKAKKIISRLKEYRRRGSLLEGVNLVTGQITLKAMAVQPSINKYLDWLNADNADDRFISEVISVMHEQPANVCVLLTADINLQNKCELAQINYIEPISV